MVGMAFVIAAGLVPALKKPARRLGLVDHPCRRKRHDGQIPLTGGLAMFLAFMTALLINFSYLGTYASLLGGMCILLIVGMLDDLLDIRALYKLTAQVLVATIMVLVSGLEVHQLGSIFGAEVGKIGLGPFSIPFTIACVVFLINAINMSDGLDGLAGGTGMFILLMLALLGWLNGAPTSLVVVCLVLATAVIGFLMYNLQSPFRQKASAFMGDAGSMMLGFGIAWLTIAMVTAESTSVYPVSIAWLLLIPATDTLAVSVRRISMGKSPMAADRSHLHHIIQRCGFSVRNTVRIIHLAVVFTGSVGVFGWYYKLPEWLLFVAAAGCMVGYMLLLANAHRIMRWRLRLVRRQEGFGVQEKP